MVKLPGPHVAFTWSETLIKSDLLDPYLLCSGTDRASNTLPTESQSVLQASSFIIRTEQ